MGMVLRGRPFGDLAARNPWWAGPEGMVLVEPKTPRSRRTIHLADCAVEALRRHRARQAEARLAAGPAWQDEGLVFSTLAGGRLDPARVNEAFHRARPRGAAPSSRPRPAPQRGLYPPGARHARP
jgi:integrase